MQDILGIGTEGRMNVPSAATGNWSWRFEQRMLTAEVAEKLRAITDITDRTEAAQREIAKAKEEDAKAAEEAGVS